MPVSKAIAQQWLALTGCNIIQAYGLTETSPAVTINPMNQKTFNGSIGLPIPNTDISIRDAHDQEVAFGEPGELCVHGPQVTPGYWKNDADSQQAIKNGWLYTGDVAYMDHEDCI